MANELFRNVKNNVTARQVLERYVGFPDKAKKWKSPFRNERTASITVKGEVINDHGGNFKGDCISFVAKLHNIKLIEAAEIIAIDFGLVTENTSKAKVSKMLKEREEKKKQEEKIRREFEFLFRVLCNVFHQYKNQELEEILLQMINCSYDIEPTKEVIEIARRYITRSGSTA